MNNYNTCERCGIGFTKRNGGPWRFCSRECANLAQRKSPEHRTCEVCGSDFLVGPYGYGYRQMSARRCSPQCRLVHIKPSAEAKLLSVAEAAYLAGLVDGEGSFMLKFHQSRTLHTRLTVTNTVREVLDWCQQVTGTGSVHPRTHNDPRWKTSYAWVVSSGAAASVIGQLRPYLIVKAAQADLALEAQARLRNPALKADRSWQDEYHERMKAMNRRGPRPTYDMTATSGG